MYNRLTMAGTPISGSLWTLWLYDVCEEIDMVALRAILKVPAPRESRVRHPSPEYVRFERPPVVQQIGAIVLDDGSRLRGELNYRSEEHTSELQSLRHLVCRLL